MASLLLTDPQRDAVFTAIVDTANAVVLPRFQNLGDGEIDTKTSPTDLVTIADREAEVRLTAALTAILPGSVVVGEEAVSADPGAGHHRRRRARVDRRPGGRHPQLCSRADAVLRHGRAGRGGGSGGCLDLAAIDAEMIGLPRRGAQLFETTSRHDRRLRVARPLAAAEMNGFVSFKYLTEEQRSSHGATPVACAGSSRSAARGRVPAHRRRPDFCCLRPDRPGITVRVA